MVILKEINVRLQKELDELEERGVKITLEGKEANPKLIVTEMCVNEESNYMRDYILDDNGILIELGFYSIKSK